MLTLQYTVKRPANSRGSLLVVETNFDNLLFQSFCLQVKAEAQAGFRALSHLEMLPAVLSAAKGWATLRGQF